jgi:hypothetical protein
VTRRGQESGWDTVRAATWAPAWLMAIGRPPEVFVELLVGPRLRGGAQRTEGLLERLQFLQQFTERHQQALMGRTRLQQHPELEQGPHPTQ